jgi:hypothetical protein
LRRSPTPTEQVDSEDTFASALARSVLPITAKKTESAVATIGAQSEKKSTQR